MLRYRLTLGPLFIAALIALFWLDSRLDLVILPESWRWLFGGRTYLPNGLALFGMAVLILPLAAWELTQILRANQIRASAWLTCLAAELGLILQYSIPRGADADRGVAVVCTGLVGVFLISLIFFSRNKNVHGVVAAAGGVMFAMIYLGLMLGFFVALRRWNSPWLILSVILITKSCDTGAFFIGRAFGRHKLIPWLSPGKTWEGFLGGLIVSSLVAVALAAWGRSLGESGVVLVREDFQYNYSYSLPQAALMGLVFGAVGQAGDLTASLLKRDAGLKDSSRLIPGFGGILDLLDSPLLVAPVAYWLLGWSTT